VHSGAFSADDFPDHSFDGIWILNCFEALPDISDALQQIRRLLKPDGRLVIRTPNAALVALSHHPRAPDWLRNLADRNALLGMPYRRCLSLPALTTVLTAQKFRVEEWRGREFASCKTTRSRIAADSARVLRLTAYQLASLPGRPQHPWLEIAATRAA
jgi:SAM-dependent methyltransferase